MSVGYLYDQYLLNEADKYAQRIYSEEKVDIDDVNFFDKEEEGDEKYYEIYQ